LITVFLSAFLLFQVQLLIGKAILPWFGGSASVWMTCLLFFQVLLCAGYAYASFVAEKLSPRSQGLVHLAVLAVAAACLPIAPSPAWKPADGSDPTWRILGLLATTVGMPFFALSATAPLIQAWSARRDPSRSPYRLYALSNAGSFLGLLAYPFAVEPSLALGAQMRAWSIGFLIFAVACASWTVRPSPAPAQAEESPRPDSVAQGAWLLLSACGSAMLLATTSRITQDVAPVPFLWVLPLALYLLSFVLAFAERRWYRRGVAGWLLAVALFLVAGVHFGRERIGLPLDVAAHGLVQFACCYACHGELANAKPSPRHLTRFYLVVSAGGALGGALVTLVAPLVLRTLADFPLALVACAAAWSAAGRLDRIRRVRFAGAKLALVAVAAVVVARTGTAAYLGARDVLEASRNFYGALQVEERDLADPSRAWRRLAHGSTAHGAQFTDVVLRRTAGSYYGPGSGIEACIEALRRAHPGALRIGVVGMGAGSLAAYARAGDALTFFEIDPDVVRLARKWFTFWSDAEDRGATLRVELGDARLSLERSRERFDLLVVDAFSGDAIPAHLLTAECFALYREHLADGGLMAVHVSNLFLHLAPVVREGAKCTGFEARNLSSPPDPARLGFANDWVAVSGDEKLLDALPVAIAAPWPTIELDRPWTDDFSSLVPLLK
jgi:spermidine synthase